MARAVEEELRARGVDALLHKPATSSGIRRLVDRLAIRERSGPTSDVLGEATVELDEVPNLGTFVEVEAASREQIDSICSQLGLDRSAAVEETYAGLLATNAVDKTFSRMEVRFKS